MQILGQEQQVQRPWGRSMLCIAEEQQRGRVAGAEGRRREARWGRASQPTVVTVVSMAEKENARGCRAGQGHDLGLLL